MKYRMLSFFARSLVSEFPLPLNVAKKIVAQVEADRERRKLYSPNYLRVRSMHDGVYNLLGQARTAGDYPSELILCHACNSLYRLMEHDVLGDARIECRERAKNWVVRQKLSDQYRNSRKAS